MLKFKLLLMVLIMPSLTTGLHHETAYPQSLAPVVAGTAVSIEHRSPVEVLGTVQPAARSRISSEIDGRITDYAIREGQYVQKDQILVRLDTSSLKISLQEAKATYNETAARQRLAANNYKRFHELYSKGIVSLQQLQDAESEKDALLARLSQLESRIDNLEHDISKSLIRAPYDGYISAEHAELGEWLGEGDPVAEIINIDQVDIRVDVPERYSPWIGLDDEVKIKLDAVRDIELKGIVTAFIPQADMQSRTFPARVRVDNKEHTIKSGMSARVLFEIGEKRDVTMVSKDAIVLRTGEYLVFIIEDGEARPVNVDTGLARGDMIEVIGDIVPGQIVVVRGNERLRSGQKVNILNKDELAEKQYQ